MASAGLSVVGVDSSPSMLDRLRRRDADGAVTTVVGDMVDDLPSGPFDVVLVAYNTLFNLLDDERQRQCFTEVAARLRPDGAFVVEAFTPDPTLDDGTRSAVTVRSLAVDRVVLSVSRQLPDDQRAEGHFVELTEGGGVRLRPWAIRWATPAQLDAMASDAGLRLADRWADMANAPFTADSAGHVSVYRRAT
jgi:SAM-dependent methyltransferase